MDPLLLTSSLNNGEPVVLPARKYKTSFSDKNFLKRAGVFNPDKSLMDVELVTLHEELFSKIEKSSNLNPFKRVFSEMNPFKTHLDYRKEDLNGTYYSFRYQHSVKSLVPSDNSLVITNDVRPLHFFSETGSKIYRFRYFDEKSSKHSSIDKEFIRNYRFLNPNSDVSIKELEITGLGEAWDNYDDLEELNFDLAVFRESSEGRDMNARLENRGPFSNGDDQIYQAIHFETCVNALSKLKDRGNAVIQFISLGSQHVADMVYFYCNIFEEVEFYMPMASDFLSMEHYLICRGFRKTKYGKLADEKLIDLIDDFSPNHNYPYYPRMSNFEQDSNFMAWIVEMNNIMMTYHLSLMMTIIQSMNSTILSNYKMVRFPFVIDPHKLKLNLGLFDINNKIDTSAFQEVQNFDWKSKAGNLNETGQVTVKEDFPKELHMDGFNYRFCLYLSFRKTEEFIISEETKYSYKISLIPNWLLDLHYSGTLDEILQTPQDQITNMRSHYKKWKYQDWFEIEDITPQDIQFDFLDKVFINLRENIKKYYGLRGELLKITKFIMTKSKNLRYRIQFSFQGRSYLLQQRNNSDLVITVKQLLGIIPSSYKTRVGFSLSTLDKWIKDRNFVIRAVNLLCIPLLSSKYSNAVAFHDFVKSERIDFDFSGTPWNRNGIHWASSWEEDTSLGALTELEAYNADSSYYENNPEIENFWLFPPQNKDIFPGYVEKITKFIIDRYNYSKRTAIYIVYLNSNERILDNLLLDLESNNVEYKAKTEKSELKYEMISGRIMGNKKCKTKNYAIDQYKFLKIEVQ